MTGYNASQIIFTKRPRFSRDSEIRAVLFSYDPVGGQACNYGVEKHAYAGIRRAQRTRLGEPWGGRVSPGS
jgi:hypothetical protein